MRKNAKKFKMQNHVGGAWYATRENQKGITLVALVITIIVLIILAAVSINAIIGDGLIGNAKIAKSDYEIGRKTEQKDLQNLMQEIENSKGSWVEVVNEDGTKTVKNTNSSGDSTKIFVIGEKVNYTPQPDITKYEVSSSESGYNQNQTIETKSNLEWYVLGVDKNGRLQLITRVDRIYLTGKKGYDNSNTIFNDICNSLYSSPELGSVAHSPSINELREKVSNSKNISPADYIELYHGNWVKHGESAGGHYYGPETMTRVELDAWNCADTTLDNTYGQWETFAWADDTYTSVVDQPTSHNVLYDVGCVVTLGTEDIPERQ